MVVLAVLLIIAEQTNGLDRGLLSASALTVSAFLFFST